MIKVCMIVHKSYYTDARVRRDAEALAEAGAQVDILCARAADRPPSEEKSGVRVFTVPIGRAEGGFGRHLLQYGKALFLFTVRLLALYAANRYQIIHVHNMPDFLVFAALIPRMLGAKVILDIHDPVPEFYVTKFKKPQTNSVGVQLMRVQEKYSAALAHAVITANSNFKDLLIRRNIPSDKITVIRNLPDPQVFDRNKYRQEGESGGEHFTLIYAGTVAPHYGLDVAIRALPSVKTRIPQLRLIILGSRGEYSQQLERLAEQLDVSALVQFRPSVPHGEVPGNLAQADVGIYTAYSNPWMNMATPTKVLEYVAMGLPVISSRLRVLEDIFTDSDVLFFEAGQESEFARCVQELFDNPARRDDLVRNADTVLARKLQWGSDRRLYLNLVNRLLAPREGIVTMDTSDRSCLQEAIPSEYDQRALGAWHMADSNPDGTGSGWRT